MYKKGEQLAEKNSIWAGDNVSYPALHTFVRRRKYKPSVCGICGEAKKLELANISGKYKRDLDDWEYICRRCHMVKDGRLEKAKKTTFRKGVFYPSSRNTKNAN